MKDDVGKNYTKIGTTIGFLASILLFVIFFLGDLGVVVLLKILEVSGLDYPLALIFGGPPGDLALLYILFGYILSAFFLIWLFRFIGSIFDKKLSFKQTPILIILLFVFLLLCVYSNYLKKQDDAILSHLDWSSSYLDESVCDKISILNRSKQDCYFELFERNLFSLSLCNKLRTYSTYSSERCLGQLK